MKSIIAACVCVLLFSLVMWVRSGSRFWSCSGGKKFPYQSADVSTDKNKFKIVVFVIIYFPPGCGLTEQEETLFLQNAQNSLNQFFAKEENIFKGCGEFKSKQKNKLAAHIRESVFRDAKDKGRFSVNCKLSPYSGELVWIVVADATHRPHLLLLLLLLFRIETGTLEKGIAHDLHGYKR